MASGPSPSPSGSGYSTVVGIASPVSAAPVLAAVASAQKTMTWTVYAHRTKVDAATGRYQFDCVGMTNYILGVAAPSANNAMRSALGISAGHTPSPAHMAQYFAGLPAAGNTHWRPIRNVTDIQGGDVIAVAPAAHSNEAGHAMIAAGPATPLADAGYSVLVYDSTAVPPPHGAYDTRLTDPRAAKLASGKPSGLGSGTVEIKADSAGVPQRLLWSVGGSSYGEQPHIARALSAAPSS